MRAARRLSFAFAAAALMSACGGTSSTTTTSGTGTTGGSVSCAYLDASYPINCTYVAADYPPGSQGNGFTFTDTTNVPNTIGVTFSGETLGVDGLPYIENLPGDPYFVDGWSVRFYEYIVVAGNIRLDPGATGSAVWQNTGAGPISGLTPVAQAVGPYVFDAHQVHGFVGKDGIEAASGIFLWSHLDNGQAFDPSQLYAWSYDVEQAKYPITNVNLNPAELPDYDLMVKMGWSKFIRGVATHTTTLEGNQGGGTPTDCTYANPHDPDAGQKEAMFEAMPQTVYFAFGWDDHTHMYNCVNPDNGDGEEDNLANRGVRTNNNGTYIAQITTHTDHIFWDTLEVEGEPLRFDPIAAYAPANTSLSSPFWINDLPQKLATTFSDGVTPLPDRAPFCTGNSQPFTTDMPNNGIQVIMSPNGVTTVPSTSYPDFMEFSVQSQSHLNSQGLCYIVGQHAADPFFTPNVTPLPDGG